MKTFDLRTADYKEVQLYPLQGEAICYIQTNSKHTVISCDCNGYSVQRVNKTSTTETRISRRERYKVCAVVRDMFKRCNVNGTFKTEREAEKDAKNRERLEMKKDGLEAEIARLKSEYNDFMKNEYIPVFGE